MRAIELTAPSLDAFRNTDLPDPRPGPGEAVVRFHAASLNFLDVAVARGAFPIATFPLIPISDGAGEVTEIGAGVTNVKVGDRVTPHLFPRWQGGPISAERVSGIRGVNLPGSLAEYAVVPSESLVHLPEHLTYEEGATLPIAATTAWNGIQSAKVRPGSSVLLLGTGGVSIFALQFAKAAGATVIITSSSDEKLERAKKLGADLTINYRATSEWDNEVLKLTDGKGVDLVIETGGADTFARSLNAAAFGGTVFVIGILSGFKPSIDLTPIFFKALKAQGNNTGSISDLQDAARAIAAAKSEPVVDRIFEFDQAASAYAHLAGGRHFGKVAIRVLA